MPPRSLLQQTVTATCHVTFTLINIYIYLLDEALRRGPHWRSVSGTHLGVLVSADVQGCRSHL